MVTFGIRFHRCFGMGVVVADYSRAATSHQSRVAAAELAAAKGVSGAYALQPWLDYARYCLRRGDVGKASECLRECLSIDSKHVESLLLLGALSGQQGDSSTAAVLLQAAVEQAGKVQATAVPLAYTLLAVCLEV